MKKQQFLILILLALFLFSAKEAKSQDGRDPGAGSVSYSLYLPPPTVAIKTNILYLMTSTLNLGVEVRTGSRFTLDISANYNPWKFKNIMIKHFMVQPELRFWTCEPFKGHFIGLHGIYGMYNVWGIKRNNDNRYQGDAYGAGISYGYQWYLSPRLNMEATVGVGYVWLDYKAYECGQCGKELYRNDRHYFGPTKIGLSLIYIIK